MKAVLISIQPKWCELIASGKKTVELRKSKPKIDELFKCYIYCTNSNGTLHSAYDGLHYHKSYIGKNDSSCINGKVIGEFVCRTIDFHSIRDIVVKEDAECTLIGTCLGKVDVLRYIGYPSGTDIYAKPYMFYGWHISDLVIYDEPKELIDFHHACKQPSETDCSRCLDEGKTNCWSLIRPPQSWCYVEELS